MNENVSLFELMTKEEMERITKKEDLIEFADVEFMTAKQKDNAYKCFKKVIDNRNISYMDKNLYTHLHVHCSFIAHYDIHGFKATYSGYDGFTRFVNHFMKLEYYVTDYPDYRDVNLAIVKYVKENYNEVIKEMKEQEKEADLAILKAISQKYNIKVG